MQSLILLEVLQRLMEVVGCTSKHKRPFNLRIEHIGLGLLDEFLEKLDTRDTSEELCISFLRRTRVYNLSELLHAS
ncbi:hypothetical protein PRUPE_8G072200 [Prunus persica]|uniref:Uncharacterized protein n=1 Tax=Prunus persica TaxID=3760 RepID=A0A251MUI6_PRUPE|nr:hypothetical protein PRUPE_8G072200 [Prunus persica]